MRKSLLISVLLLACATWLQAQAYPQSSATPAEQRQFRVACRARPAATPSPRTAEQPTRLQEIRASSKTTLDTR